MEARNSRTIRLDKVLLLRIALFCVEVPQNTRKSMADKVTKESFIEKKNKKLAKIAMPDFHATPVGYKLIINSPAMTASSFFPSVWIRKTNDVRLRTVPWSTLIEVMSSIQRWI